MSFSTFVNLLDERLQRLCETSFRQFTDAMVPYSKPILKIDVMKWKSDGYIDQRNMEKSLWLMVTGHLGKDSISDGDTDNDWTLEDQLNLIDFSDFVVTDIYKIHDETQLQTFVCPGFSRLGEFPEVWMDLEIAPKLMTFRFQLEVKFIKKDTEV